MARVWYGKSFGNNSDIWYSEPASHDVQKIETNGTTTFVIPTTPPEYMKHADAVCIYVHSGGLFIGYPLQYLDEYKRWVKLAREAGEEIVILAPTYPLSPQTKWPAQRKALLNLYTWAITKSIPLARLVLGGDSAGVNIVLLTLLHIRDYQAELPQPSCAIGFTREETRYTPRIRTDFMFGFSDIVLFMNDTLRPKALPFDTAEISSLLAENVGGLPPQLIYWSTTEVLSSDAERWVQ